MVLGGAGWDRKEFPESDLHMCGRDDTKTIVYNVRKCTKKEKGEIRRKKKKKIQNKTANSCIILLINKTI